MRHFSSFALVATLFFTAQGCVWSANSRMNTPYGQSSSRQVCAFGNCFNMQEQDVQATVNTPGYAACIQAFTADNARATMCAGDASTCTAPQYSQVQIMDACTLRAAYLNGGMGLGMGFMNWGAGLGWGAGSFGPGAYSGGTHDPRNAAAIASGDVQRRTIAPGY